MKHTRIIALLLVVFVSTALAQNGPSATQGTFSERNAVRAAGTVFRDCPECPEMVVVPGGTFTMGSSAAEKSWAAAHGVRVAKTLP
jgi:formylglycine-generating enzyme required for sulfatase activity